MTIEWEEYTLSSEPESEIDLDIPKVEEISHNSEDTQFFHLKENLRQSLLPQWDLEFDPVSFLSTNLLGKIYLKLDRSLSHSSSILVDELLDFYERKFIEDDEIPYLITYCLLKSNRLKNLLQFLQVYLSRGKISLELEIFLIVGGVLSTELPNIILSGDEKNLLNILYKFKHLKLSEAERNHLYDITLMENNDELLGLVFYLFKNTYRGVRRINPIQDRLLKKFSILPIEERLEFLESYKRTGKYLKIYFLMKMIFTDEEIKSYMSGEKDINGKSRSQSISDDFESNFEYSKKVGRFDILSPFDLVRGLSNPDLRILIRKSLFDYQERYPHAYGCNLGIAILYFYEKDYNKFLLYSEMGGSLRFFSEFLYLKMYTFIEMGYQTEAAKILGLLLNRFPNSEILLELKPKISSIA